LDIIFLHNVTHKIKLKATWDPIVFSKNHQTKAIIPLTKKAASKIDFESTLNALLQHPNIASKQSVVRQYDHEVQGGSIIKPFMGTDHDAPTDASVFRPKLNSWKGLVISNGMNPEVGKWDPYVMAKMSVDEAYRNLIAVGGGIKYAAILDNFCWGDSKNEFELGGLIRASEGAKEAAMIYGLPFISGKDSFNNTWKTSDGTLHSIPPTLLISAMGVLEDVRTCVSSSLKTNGNLIYLVGITRPEMKGSVASQLWGEEGELSDFSLQDSKNLYKKFLMALRNRLIISCHDISDGGMAIAALEMAFGSSLGLELNLKSDIEPSVQLFSETPSRFLVEIAPENKGSFETIMGLAFVTELGKVITKKEFIVRNSQSTLIQQSVLDCKTLWKESLKALS
ncbi:MAG: AIR synthase-related protein, partial [Elusimicrobiota bacterium]